MKRPSKVEKGKYTYQYVNDSWHWVFQKAEETNEDREDHEVIKEDKNVR
jgi:hypothetical protein